MIEAAGYSNPPASVHELGHGRVDCHEEGQKVGGRAFSTYCKVEQTFTTFADSAGRIPLSKFTVSHISS